MGRSVQDFNADDVSIHIVVEDEPIFDLVALMILPFPELGERKYGQANLLDDHIFCTRMRLRDWLMILNKTM